MLEREVGKAASLVLSVILEIWKELELELQSKTWRASAVELHTEGWHVSWLS